MTEAPAHTTVDDAEIRRFSAMADSWWDPMGKFRPLHKLNPGRLAYIKAEICRQFGRDVMEPRALAGLDLLDIGCGGGLIAEPMAAMGARVTGADASATNVEVARLHAERSGLSIDYRATTAEDLAASGAGYDVVLALEIVEHVSDIGLFVSECARMVRPGGLLIMSTINRTAKSFALAIVGAEYVLRWLPRGTHDWKKFVTPTELARTIGDTGLTVIDEVGMTYNPLRDLWSVNRGDRDVNYMMTASRPRASG